MADASSSRYSVVVGRFDFDASRLPETDHGLPDPSEVAIPAVLSGRALSRTGFDAPYAKSVTLDVSCALSWCGSVVPGQPYLVFVEHKSSGFTVELGACATVVFPNPTVAEEREITRCLTSGGCGTR